MLSLLPAACSKAADALADGPGARLRALTGAHTRVVWVQGDGTDPETEGDQLILMGLDSDDGKGERVILGYQFAVRELAFGNWALFPRSAPR